VSPSSRLRRAAPCLLRRRCELRRSRRPSTRPWRLRPHRACAQEPLRPLRRVERRPEGLRAGGWGRQLALMELLRSLARGCHMNDSRGRSLSADRHSPCAGGVLLRLRGGQLLLWAGTAAFPLLHAIASITRALATSMQSRVARVGSRRGVAALRWAMRAAGDRSFTCQPRCSGDVYSHRAILSHRRSRQGFCVRLGAGASVPGVDGAHNHSVEHVT
jgi:hypothetical protein